MSSEHQDVRLLLGAYVLGALEDADSGRVQDHLSGCQLCRGEVAELAVLPQLLRRRSTSTMTGSTRTSATGATSSTRPGSTALLALGALLCLAVTYIHLADQGGYPPSGWFPGDTDPQYIKIGYYLLEAGGVAAALLLLLRRRLGWVLALPIAAGPFIGYVLTRTTGLPDATDDKGNWVGTLGIASLIVEALLFGLAWGQLRRPAD